MFSQNSTIINRSLYFYHFGKNTGSMSFGQTTVDNVQRYHVIGVATNRSCVFFGAAASVAALFVLRGRGSNLKRISGWSWQEKVKS